MADDKANRQGAGVTPPAVKTPTRQAAARQRNRDAGGHYLSLELSPMAVVHLHHVKQRDGHHTAKQVVEASLALNATTLPVKGRE